jgi:hypothetical protein
MEYELRLVMDVSYPHAVDRVRDALAQQASVC